VEINWFLLELSVPGLSPKDWLKRKSERERAWTLRVFLNFPFVVRGDTFDFSFRGDDLEFGEAAGQPSEVYGSCCIAGC
jgi:hypothetical protein